MKTKLPLFLIACGFAAFGSGCTFPSRGTVYDRSAVGRSMTVETGDVVAVREVEISGRNTVIGVGGGAITGRAAASGVGQGVGNSVAQAAGAVGGAILGEAVEEVATRKRAQELTIKMSNGDTVAIVQQVGNDGMFTVGEHVQVYQGGAGSTVRRLY